MKNTFDLIFQICFSVNTSFYVFQMPVFVTILNIRIWNLVGGHTIKQLLRTSLRLLHAPGS